MRPASWGLKLRFTDNPLPTPKEGTQLAPDHSNSVITCSDNNNKQHFAGVARYTSEQQLSLQNHLHPHPQGYKAEKTAKVTQVLSPSAACGWYAGDLDGPSDARPVPAPGRGQVARSFREVIV